MTSPSRRPPSVLRSFLDSEASAGYLLIVAAALALIVANSPAAPSYFATLKIEIGGDVGPVHLRESLLHWINDGLMAIFFLLVGLEIKREVLDGQLRGLSRIALPGLAAAGGMVVPALLYVAANLGHAPGLRGWAIPSATDIAFALGILALAGPRVPVSLKIFLTALAIIDDLGAILIIAVAYTASLNLAMLGVAIALIVLLTVLNRLGVTRLAPYLIIGVLLWYIVLQSGIHATLAGVALALTIPLKQQRGHPDDLEHSPLHHLEHALHKPVGFLIVPLFGFANAGVSFAGVSPAQVLDPVPLGIILGLFVGKQVGVFGATWLAVKFDLADYPRDASMLQVYGTALLCGIGFTMSLFIGNLAFTDPGLIDETKIGVLAGSLLSALAGFFVLRLAGGQGKIDQSAMK
jgi:NhaA family Na+:H+ antiporter